MRPVYMNLSACAEWQDSTNCLAFAVITDRCSGFIRRSLAKKINSYKEENNGKSKFQIEPEENGKRTLGGSSQGSILLKKYTIFLYK